jgi:hypothetical protein
MAHGWQPRGNGLLFFKLGQGDGADLPQRLFFGDGIFDALAAAAATVAVGVTKRSGARVLPLVGGLGLFPPLPG